MKLLLVRDEPDQYRMFGELFVDGVWECVTLEDPVRPVKIKGITAIPAGRYRISMEDSPHFGPDTLTINDVPGFSFVRVHSGNTEMDTEGCLLVGQAKNSLGLLRSAAALRALKPKVAAGLEDGEVWLTIENP